MRQQEKDALLANRKRLHAVGLAAALAWLAASSVSAVWLRGMGKQCLALSRCAQACVKLEEEFRRVRHGTERHGASSSNWLFLFSFFLFNASGRTFNTARPWRRARAVTLPRGSRGSRGARVPGTARSARARSGTAGGLSPRLFSSSDNYGARVGSVRCWPVLMFLFIGVRWRNVLKFRRWCVKGPVSLTVWPQALTAWPGSFLRLRDNVSDVWAPTWKTSRLILRKDVPSPVALEKASNPNAGIVSGW